MPSLLMPMIAFSFVLFAPTLYNYTHKATNAIRQPPRTFKRHV